MRIKYRDKDGNLYCHCEECNSDFNFKAMKYITESDECPNCEAKIKLTGIIVIDNEEDEDYVFE